MLKKYSLLIILLSACADNTNNYEQKSEGLGAPNQNDDLKYLGISEEIYTPRKHQVALVMVLQFNFGFGQYSKSGCGHHGRN